MKTEIAAAPPAPTPVSAGESMRSYMESVSDPALQQAILNAEGQFRPQFDALNLQQMQRYLTGYDGNPGALDQLLMASEKSAEAQAAGQTIQRAADIADVEALGARASAAFQNANPALKDAMAKAQALQSGGFNYAPTPDYAGYVKSNQDLYNNWLNNTSKNTNLTIEQYGQQHYDTSGKNEGRTLSMTGGSSGTGPANPYAAFQNAVLSGQPNFGQLTAPNAQASLLGNAPMVQSTGYNAAMLGTAPTAGAQQIASQDVGSGLLGQSLYQQALGAGGLGATGSMLDARAQQLAQSNGAMTPDEARVMEQQLRASFGARGTLDSSRGITAEALGRLTNERQNMMNNLSMASALNQASQAELGANRGFQQNVQGADLTRQFQNVGNSLNAQAQNQQANLQASLANQGMAGQYGLANQAAANQAAQYSAGAANTAAMANQGATAQYGLANQAAANQFGMFNAQNQLGVQEANRAFDYNAYNQQMQNLGILGQFGQSQLGADRGYALSLLGAQSGIASDPFQAILGRPSQAAQMGAGQLGYSAGMLGIQGPQLFDPNAGVNLALQNNANLGNYNAATYGARAAAQGAASAGFNSMLGNIGGSLFGAAGAAGGFGKLF